MAECTMSIEEASGDPAKNCQNEKVLIFPQVKSAVTASLGLFIIGTIHGWSGSFLVKMKMDFKMEATEESLVGSSISSGALLGCIIAGQVMDILGRKKLMLITAPLVVCGWIVIGTATNVYLVYIGRFVCGVCTGFLFTSCSIYTSETCQSALRGRFSSLSTLSMTFGILISYILGDFVSWKLSTFLCIIPALLFFVNLCTVPESPYWYLLKGNDKAASESLTRLRGPNFNIEHEIKEMRQKISDVGTNISYLELLKRRTLLPLAVALFIQTLQQVAGANIITTYASNIFKKAESSIDAQMATIYTGIAQVVGTLISMLLIDKCGRRILLTLSGFLCGTLTALFGGYFITLSSENSWPAWLPLPILICLTFSYCLGCRNISLLIGSELFNTSVRSRANSVVTFYNRALCAIILETYPYLGKSFGESAVFLFYGMLCLCFTVGVLLFVPETKGKTLEEIQGYFEKKLESKLESKLDDKQ